jgi:RNA polymerase sigma factor (sigma-70 family)
VAPRHAAFTTLLRTVGRAADTRSDARLLADFYAHRDEAAFATLVRRHQRAVWAVCARVLTDPADAEDAFQATFLVLARSGKLLADRGSVGGWLYRVAERVARKARTMAINRKRRERKAGRPEAVTAPPADDLFEVVSAELDQLPEAHRLAVIVFDLDGLSRTDAAARLGWNEGTLSARLHRGRKELAERLRARGVTAPLVGLAAAFATSTVPARAADAAVELACVVVESGLTCRAVPASVAALVSQTTKEMAMRITTKVLATLTLAAGVLGFGWVGLPSGADPRAAAAPVPEVKKAATLEVPPAAYQLLRVRKVLRELKCTPEQRVTIEDYFDDKADKAAEANGGVVFAVPPPPAGGDAAKANQEQFEAEVTEIKNTVEKVLKPSQLLRLAEIDLQVRGADAFANAKVADALKLTDEQKKAIGEVIDELKNPNGGVRALPPAGAPGGVVVWSANVGADPKARKAACEKAEEVLTKEQKAVWKKMVGEPVALFDPHALAAGPAGGSITVRGGMVAPPIRVVPGRAIPALPLVPPAAPPKKDDE